jgi:hypothetical protein
MCCLSTHRCKTDILVCTRSYEHAQLPTCLWASKAPPRGVCTCSLCHLWTPRALAAASHHYRHTYGSLDCPHRLTCHTDSSPFTEPITLTHTIAHEPLFHSTTELLLHSLQELFGIMAGSKGLPHSL